MTVHSTGKGPRIGGCDYVPGAASNDQLEDSGLGSALGQALGGLFNREQVNDANQAQRDTQLDADNAVSRSVDAVGKALGNLFGNWRAGSAPSSRG